MPEKTKICSSLVLTKMTSMIGEGAEKFIQESPILKAIFHVNNS
jgi:hypothetical protein